MTGASGLLAVVAGTTAAGVAFAPGSIETMIVLAFALGLDPAYVGVHQMARHLAITLFTPVAAAWLSRRRASGTVPEAGKATVPPSSVD